MSKKRDWNSTWLRVVADHLGANKCTKAKVTHPPRVCDEWWRMIWRTWNQWVVSREKWNTRTKVKLAIEFFIGGKLSGIYRGRLADWSEGGFGFLNPRIFLSVSAAPQSCTLIIKLLVSLKSWRLSHCFVMTLSTSLPPFSHIPVWLQLLPFNVTIIYEVIILFSLNCYGGLVPVTWQSQTLPSSKC